MSAAVQMATEGRTVGLLHDANAREDVPIVLRLPRSAQGSLAAVRELRLGPNLVAVGELTREETRTEADSLYHKNLLPVTYVTGDLAGADESPVYAILRMNSVISKVTLPEGYAFEIYNTRQPFDTTKYAMKWDGEWHITYEVFRDLGLAFAAVLVLIYILVVWWFEAFDVPLTIMAAIPFSLVGILPAHAAMGAFFTATSMIGFIAGAGIVVRNSIILVDFIEMRRAGGHAACRRRRGRRRGPLPPDGAHGGGGDRRVRGDPLRSDLPGPGDFLDGGRGGVVAALAGHRSRVVFHESPEAAHDRCVRGAIASRSTVMSPVAKVSRVLVGVDFDEASASALKMAGVLASTWDADITVFHASTLEAPAYFTADQNRGA